MKMNDTDYIFLLHLVKRYGLHEVLDKIAEECAREYTREENNQSPGVALEISASGRITWITGDDLLTTAANLRGDLF
jgi:hypothetical protein